VNEEGKTKYEESMRGYLSTRVSRATALKAAAVGVAAAAIPGAAAADTINVAYGPTGQPLLSFPYFPQVTSGRYEPESISDIVNIAQTAEHLAVTVLTAGVNNAAKIGLTGITLETVQAILSEEIIHIQVLAAAFGAKPLTDSFTIPDPKILSDFMTFFETLEVADTIFNAAYMTATREFAELGQPTLAKITYQTGSVEAEHRVLARATLAQAGNNNYRPVTNKAYETDLFLYVRDAAKALTDLGFLGGSGTAASFPGLDAATAAAGPVFAKIIQRTPNNATSSINIAGGDSPDAERA